MNQQFIIHIKRVSKYVIIGVFASLGMWITWNLLLMGFNRFDILPQPARLGTGYLIASLTWIYPSFYLNRLFTFKDKDLSSRLYSRTLTKVYAVYIASPLIATAIMQFVQTIIPDSVEQLSTTILLFDRSLNIAIVAISIQLMYIGINFVCNYAGQLTLVYKSNLWTMLKPILPFHGSSTLHTISSKH